MKTPLETQGRICSFPAIAGRSYLPFFFEVLFLADDFFAPPFLVAFFIERFSLT